MVDRSEHGDGCLDFGLGLFLGPLGILIAAVIDKASGVRAAIRGMLVACLLYALIYALIVGGFIRYFSFNG